MRDEEATVHCSLYQFGKRSNLINLDIVFSRRLRQCFLAISLLCRSVKAAKAAGQQRYPIFCGVMHGDVMFFSFTSQVVSYKGSAVVQIPSMLPIS